ncbi:MAG TPA: YdcF family protein [Gemmataceae bacterium]|nr:YdcF family protein [Gemmataceae bacterium]
MTSGQHGGILSKLVLLLALLSLCGVLYLLRQPLLRAAGEFWVVNEPLEAADAILLLSDDNYLADRAVRAAELYHAGWAPRVVASGRQLRRYAGISELMRRDLLERGVPANSVVVFPHTSDSTREEAQALGRLVVERGWRRVVVVTSNYHTRRARYIFRRVFPPAVQVRVTPARDTYYDPDGWWHSRQGVKIFFRETWGTLVAFWELRHKESPAADRQVSVREPCHPWGLQGKCCLSGTGIALRSPIQVAMPAALYYIPAAVALSH